MSIALGGAALALAAGVLIDWRRTLQYIGTGGLLFTALLRTTSYSRPQVQHRICMCCCGMQGIHVDTLCCRDMRSMHAAQDLLDDVSSVSNTVGAPLAAIAGTTKVLARKVSLGTLLPHIHA